MAQDQSPRFRRECYLSRLARRRMPRLLGPLLLLLPKRRLVNQQIRPLRRVHHRGTRPRVARENHQPARALRAHDPLGTHRPPVRQSDCLTLLQLPPQVPFRNAGRPRFVGIKPPGTLMLTQRISHRSAAMLRREHVNLVRLPPPGSRLPNRFAWLHLNDLDFERHPLDSELNRLAEYLLSPPRPIQPHRLGACLQPQRANQSDHAKEVVRVKMSEEDLRQREAHPVAHHLALGALAALEQESLPFPHERHRGDVALDGGPGGRGAQESHGKHGREYRAVEGGGRRWRAVPRTLLACIPAHVAPPPSPCPRRRTRKERARY